MRHLYKNDAFFTIAVVALVATVSFLLDVLLLPAVGILLIFQLGVVTVSLVCEKAYSITSGLLGALIYNFFFTAPRYSFHMSDAEDITNVLVFITTAVITSQLSSYYRRQQEALKKAQLRSSILLSVSHDLRTPLSSMIGSLATLQTYKQQLSAKEQDELLSGALEESHRLHRYVENLLQATKLQHGELNLNRSRQPLPPVVESVIERIRSPRVTLSYPHDLPDVEIRKPLFEQALYNLLDNALKFSPPGSPVEVNLATHQSRLTIDIKDEGTGIPVEHHSSIFDTFYSTRKGDTGEGGTGLGLPVAKGIIEGHAGKLELLQTQQGCIFRISLPPAEVTL